LHGTK